MEMIYSPTREGLDQVCQENTKVESPKPWSPLKSLRLGVGLVLGSGQSRKSCCPSYGERAVRAQSQELRCIIRVDFSEALHRANGMVVDI